MNSERKRIALATAVSLAIAFGAGVGIESVQAEQDVIQLASRHLKPVIKKLQKPLRAQPGMQVQPGIPGGLQTNLGDPCIPGFTPTPSQIGATTAYTCISQVPACLGTRLVAFQKFQNNKFQYTCYFPPK